MTDNKNNELFGPVSRRRFLGMSGLAAGAVALGACGTDEADTTTTAAAAATTAAGVATTAASGGIPTVSASGITVGYNNPNRMLRSPLYLGQSQELGFFEEVGITDVTINDADDPVPPMLAGEYKISGFDADVLFDAIDKDVLDAKMLNINLGSQALILIANAGITNADDLRGKRVGTGRAGGVNEAFAKYMLEDLGLDPAEDVIATEMTGGSNDWVQAMLTGQIDATIAFARHIPLAIEAGGSALYNDFLPLPQFGFAMRTEDIEADPNFPAAWAYAYIQAQRWAKDPANFEDLVRILSEEFEIDLPDAFFDDTVYQIDNNTMTQDLGFDPAEMDNLMEFVIPFGNVAPDINSKWRDWVDVSGLHVAQAALGLDLNPAADLSSGEEKVAPLGG
jgi:ABC-type nitrate/sulfonate/bicarbonate transport system substrate-binding protein